MSRLININISFVPSAAYALVVHGIPIMKTACVIFQRFSVKFFYSIFFLTASHTLIVTADDSSSDSSAVKTYQAEEIIVRSTRIQSEAAQTPFPVAVLQHDQLQQQHHLTISDAVKNSSGISLVRDGAWETGISIRGMSRSNIVTLVDNTRIETANDIGGTLSLFNINDLERVEIVRSSGAALYGTGALGGVVQFVTRRAAFSQESQLSAEASSGISSVNNCASHYLAVEQSSNNIALRLSGGYRKADNVTTPAGVLFNSQFRNFNFSGSLEVKTFETHTLHFSYQRFQAENTGIPGGAPIVATATATYKFMNRELFGAEYVIPNISSSIQSFTARISRQNIIRNVEIIQTPVLTLTPHAIHSTTSVQIESGINPVENNSLVAGMEVWQRALESKRERINKTNSSITGERPVPQSQFLSAGIYVQDEWNILPEQLKLLAGARYDRIYINNDETKNSEYLISNGVLQTVPQNQVILWKKGTAENNSWSANGGVQYSLNANVDMTLLASTAFRSPSLEERYQFLDLGTVIRAGNPNLKPEQSIGLNGGFRFHADALTIQTDFFLNHLTGLVTDVPGMFENRPAYIKQNIGKARLYGYEISVEHLLASWSEVKAAISYVRGEDIQNHTNLPQIAPLHGSVECSAHLQSVGAAVISIEGSATQYYLASGELHRPGYAVFDFGVMSESIEINGCRLGMQGGIQNIFNKEYYNFLSTLRGNIKAEPGRNFYLSVAVSI